MSKVLSAAQIPDKYEFTEFNTIARVCFVFPYSLHSDAYVCEFPDRFTSNCEHSLFCSKIRGNERKRTNASGEAASRQSTREWRVFARLCSFVFIPTNLRAKENTRSPSLNKPPTCLKRFSLVSGDTLFKQAPVFKRISTTDCD